MGHHIYWTSYSGINIRPEYRGNQRFVLLIREDTSIPKEIFQSRFTEEVHKKPNIENFISLLAIHGINGIIYSGINDAALSYISEQMKIQEDVKERPSRITDELVAKVNF